MPEGEDLTTISTALISVALVVVAVALLLVPTTRDYTTIASSILGAVGGYWLHVGVSRSSSNGK